MYSRITSSCRNLENKVTAYCHYLRSMHVGSNLCIRQLDVILEYFLYYFIIYIYEIVAVDHQSIVVVVHHQQRLSTANYQHVVVHNKYLQHIQVRVHPSDQEGMIGSNLSLEYLEHLDSAVIIIIINYMHMGFTHA
jgi:hypothetical protein